MAKLYRFSGLKHGKRKYISWAECRNNVNFAEDYIPTKFKGMTSETFESLFFLLQRDGFKDIRVETKRGKV